MIGPESENLLSIEEMKTDEKKKSERKLNTLDKIMDDKWGMQKATNYERVSKKNR
jgi:hypothetical protein